MTVFIMNVKKQHFVPRFYLKNFTNNPKEIGVYNFKNKRLVKSSNLYNQCQKDFFYDNDNVIEKNLSVIEKDVSELLKKIIKDKSLSVLSNEELYNILFFVVLQNSRTEVSCDKISQLGHAFFDKVLSDKELRIGKGHILAMKYTWMLTYISSDLKLALLINETQIPFITSDHPVSMTNPIFDKINSRSLGGTGYAKKGLIIAFPISSKLCLIYYDDNSYFFGRGESDIVIKNINNIRSINKLSASSCNENFYFDPMLSDDVIMNIVSESTWKKNKKYNLTSIESTECLTNDTIGLRLHSSSIPEYRGFLLNGVMKINKKGIRFIKEAERDSMIINKKEGVRCLEWVNLIKSFHDEVKKGAYKHNDLHKFIEDKKIRR